MMRKLFGVVLIMCITLSMIAGCAGEPNGTTGSGQQSSSTVSASQGDLTDYRMPTADEDFFELVCDHTNVTMYICSFPRQEFWTFQLLSVRDLSGEVVTITSDLGGTYTWTPVTGEGEEPVALSEVVFLGYQDFDWTSVEGDRNVLVQQMELVRPAFTAAKNATPQLYSYRVTVLLRDLGIDFGKNSDDRAELPLQKIETLSVTVGEQTKTYTLDNFEFVADKLTQKKEGSVGLNSISGGAVSDYPAAPSADGTLSLPEMRYKATNDVVLQGCTVPGAEVLACDIIIETPLGDKFKMSWDFNSPLEVDEGSVVTIENLVIQDPALKQTLFVNTLRYLIMHYTCDGEECAYNIPVSIRMRQDPFDIYAMKVDGVDMLPYYLEYLNAKS